MSDILDEVLDEYCRKLGYSDGNVAVNQLAALRYRLEEAERLLKEIEVESYLLTTELEQKVKDFFLGDTASSS